MAREGDTPENGSGGHTRSRNFQILDFIVGFLALAVASVILVPVLKDECLAGELLGLYEQVVMAAIAIIAAYCGRVSAPGA